MEKMLLKVLKSKGAMLTETYSFLRGKYEVTTEIIKNETPSYRLLVGNEPWDEGMELTKKEFKELKPYFQMSNLQVWPFDERTEVLMIDYVLS